jgi:hypothetical protein
MRVKLAGPKSLQVLLTHETLFQQVLIGIEKQHCVLNKLFSFSTSYEALGITVRTSLYCIRVPWLYLSSCKKVIVSRIFFIVEKGAQKYQ